MCHFADIIQRRYCGCRINQLFTSIQVGYTNCYVNMVCFFLDGSPHVCSGKNSSNCIRYNPTADNWTISGNLAYQHYMPGFTLHSKLGLVITGNFDRTKPGNEKSENTLDGQDIRVIKELVKTLLNLMQCPTFRFLKICLWICVFTVLLNWIMETFSWQGER